jgi:sugar phosphate isomerase/epimerase
VTAKVSIGTSAFVMGACAANPIPFEKVAARLGELGYDGLELPAVRGYGALEDWSDPASRKTLMKLVGDHGLEISSYGADLSPSPFYSPDPAVRAAGQALFEKSVEFCADCRIPVIRVDTLAGPPEPPGVPRVEAWRRAVEAFRGCAEIAGRRGVVVAWEFEPGFMFNKPGEIAGLVAEVAHPNFKVLFDFCHANMCAAVGARQQPPRETLIGGAAELARKLEGHIGFVHLIDSDNTLHDGMTSTHAPFGKGVLDIEALARAMVSAGYRGPWWAVDLCFWPGAWEELEPSLRFVRKLLADLDIAGEETT